MANPSIERSVNSPHRIPPEASSVALGRQPQATDDVHYTTSPFEAPRDSERPNVPGAPVDPADKRGLVSRTAGTVMLLLSAVLAVAGVILTAMMHVHLSIPIFLVAAGLVYAGRRFVRSSAEKVNAPRDADPGRRRQPDFDD